MPLDALTPPQTDPTPIFEVFRNGYATELLTVAVADFDLFTRLQRTPLTFEEICHQLQLAPRAAHVLLTALRSMGLVLLQQGRYVPSAAAAEHLVSGEYFEVGGYVGLVADAPQVRAMARCLKTNQPMKNREEDSGAAFIFREGVSSAMEQEQSARRLTLALAGRAKNVAPSLAARIDLAQTRTLLDLGGGTGIYSIACLQKYPHLKAIVFDHPQVLKVAAEMAQAYGVADRLLLHSGDMFADPLPKCEAILLSNVLHDWDVPECEKLVARCAQTIPQGGQVIIHDVFLNDDLGGPFALAMYSAALFTLTEGRAYSAEEYRTWLRANGLLPQPIQPTLVHCGLLSGIMM
jgi:predicted O-methyltransferase YrrM